MTQGHLWIVAAPSGAGKTSLVKTLVSRVSRLAVSVSYTTRAPRSGEVDGEHYHFIDPQSFDKMTENDMWLEHAEVFGSAYGTAREATRQMLDAGTDVLLEIDCQGAFQVKARFPEAVSIFILPPSRHELERRLRSRQQDSDAVIVKRLAAAAQELRQASEFDFLLVNEAFEEAVQGLEAMLSQVREQRRLREETLPVLLADF